MTLFKMSPDELNRIGQQIVEESTAFGQHVKTIYTTIDGMVSKNYLSKDSIAIANEIKRYEQSLIGMTKTIESYGIHCQNSARQTVGTSDSIVSGIRH